MSAVLPPRLVARPWGRDCLPAPFFSNPGERIGEIWFEPPAMMPELLVKYIFTSQPLSVQVHPSDAQAPGQGKDECWLVISAEPGAKLGIGFRRSVNVAEIRDAALDGSIVDLLAWHDVKAGDFFQIPAGTVHAIGAGISLIEVQQNSDATYRLYDYDRGRELHLEQALAVADCSTYPTDLHLRVGDGPACLREGPLFRMDRISGAPDNLVKMRYDGSPVLVVPLAGEVRMGMEKLMPGNCGLACSLGDLGFSGEALLAQSCKT